MAYIDTFRRIETKYLLNPAQFEGMARLLDGRMTVDDYGKSTICNIYCDTPDCALARASIEKPVFKEKLRLRSYGVPGEDGVVFVEIKRKYKGVVYKRRTDMTWNEAIRWLNGAAAPRESQIQLELDRFRDFYHPVATAAVCYDRVALYGDDPGFRLTIDENIRWRDDRLTLPEGDGGQLLLPEGMRLMEVKTTGALPLWFVEGLERLNVRPASFSKYGEVYQRYLFPKLAACWNPAVLPEAALGDVPEPHLFPAFRRAHTAARSRAV